MSVGSFKVPISAGSPASDAIHYITATGTLAIPDGCVSVKVIAIGGGGGGGSGRKGASLSQRSGGGGGIGGTLAINRVLRSAIADTSLNITIGAGGAGGAAQATNSTNGLIGTNGGTTSVDGTVYGDLAKAVGGLFGGAGSTGVGYSQGPADATLNTPKGNFSITRIQGPYIFNAAHDYGGYFGEGLGGRGGAPCGGSGTWIMATDLAGNEATKKGGGCYNAGTLVSAPADGNGGDNVGLTLDPFDGIVFTSGVGTGGSGGKITGAVAAGNGGLYGAGGGGGSAGTDDVLDSQKGGDGANGLVIVVFRFY